MKTPSEKEISDLIAKGYTREQAVSILKKEPTKVVRPDRYDYNDIYMDGSYD